MHILILCEDEMLRELLGQNLAHEGLAVTESATFAAAGLGPAPDVVVVDGIGCDQAAEAQLDALRDAYGDPAPAVVLIVGSVSRLAVRSHPMVEAVITAPFGAESLSELVERVHRRRAHGLIESGTRLRIPDSAEEPVEVAVAGQRSGR